MPGQAAAQRKPYVQYAALPYRLDADGRAEVLLVTSRRTRRWILPKGWPIKGLKPAKAAAREAYEEAGIIGDVANTPVGTFCYDKLFERTGELASCTVEVFPLRVTQQLDVWPEAGQRRTQWTRADALAEAIEDRGLLQVIEAALETIGD